jgi:mono/diheme cytochrome c family protein
MSKRTFIVFGSVVVVLVVLIPWLAFRADGDADAGGRAVPADLESGQSLFETNCGTCHTLYAAGTDGNYGPDLDELLAPAGPPEGSTAKSTIEGHPRPRPQRDRKRRRHAARLRPHAGRHPQPRAGRGSR